MGIKILQIINRPAITGGMERYALDLSKFLKKRGHEVFMAVRGGTDLAMAVDEAGIKRIPITRGGAIQPYNVFSIARAILAEKFDILHAHTGNDYWPPLLAKWLTLNRSARVFVTRHILSPPRGFSSRFYFQNVD
ncbi:MAG TPA: glycosyltransferase family 4 protein, partial [Candidatus Wallbacteria bacterium]|nr:glycosyltransferase family 4 protein [Candidatus Wallbacteria bacterium]